MQRHFENSDELCGYVAGMSDTVILSFSLGKDSIGAWFRLREYFKKIHLFYFYLVPDLDFVNRSIRYYEDFFKTEIALLPSPSLYRMLNNLVFQAPENCHIVEEMELEGFDYDGIVKEWKRDIGVDSGTFVAHGTRANDSIMRRTSLKKWGSLNPNRRTFMPIYDWNKERLKQCLRDNRIKLPVDYEMFGRSFDGIDYRFLKPIKDRFPKDYERILEYFPLAELEIKRREYREKYYGETT
jgi:predicted phosphoadenosine phosphosulfate sulfurtransferase